MHNYVLVAALAMGVFAAMVFLLASNPKISGRIAGICLVIATLGGIFFYGYGFAATQENLSVAVVRALLGICGMFLGNMDLSEVADAPLLENQWMQLLFWLVHLAALYATASAAIAALGAGALRKLRLRLAIRSQLNVIYGVSDASVTLGRDLLEKKQGLVVFVADQPDTNLEEAIGKEGCVLRSDGYALNADEKFAAAIGATRKNRRITLYAVQPDKSDNLRYATSFLKTLQGAAIDPEKTSLVIHSREDAGAERLQVLGEKYGYGFVTVFQEEQLTARMLMKSNPPCDCVSFDENGLATEDFEAAVIGFGQVGQTVLRHLVMNSQFQGSTFHATVISPDCQSTDGKFRSCYEMVLEKYDIDFCPWDARSREMFTFLQEHKNTLKYIVVCTGSEKVNQELAEDLLAYFNCLDIQLPIHLCDHQGIRTYDTNGQLNELQRIYQYQVLSTTDLDELAIILNHHYMGAYGKSPLEDWLSCDYFSRMSCRASADFLGAMLRSVGKTKEQVAEKGWELTPAQLENLSRTEHLRWCAFHFCMGFKPMSAEEHQQRAMIYKEQLEKDGKATIRIGKNMAGRTHACLIDWEELDDLSQWESAVMNKKVDYKIMDTDNVLAIPELIQKSMKA